MNINLLQKQKERLQIKKLQNERGDNQWLIYLTDWKL